ncbi:MAG: hypothetical protein JO224_09880 [Pelomonas sp.]|nr:hypothetical protein [Roseateles sp.]
MRQALLALLIVASARSAWADESAYRLGEDAWRTQDYAEARRQWRLAIAEGGSLDAYDKLGYLLYYGLGGDADPGQAVELWRRGAVLALPESQLHLGSAFEDGVAVRSSRALAYAWYLCAVATAARHPKTDAIEADVRQSAETARDRLAPKLSRADRVEGERVAQELIAKYSAPLALEPAQP